MKTIIVDDHPLMRIGIRGVLLNSNLEVEVVGETGSGAELLKLLSKESCECDIVLLDIELTDRNGLDMMQDLSKMYSKLPVLILSAHSEKYIALRALKSGASGYLNKKVLQAELVKAVRTIVEQKKRYITEDVAEALASQLVGETKEFPHQNLTDREYEVLILIAKGNKVSEIAEKLSLSVQTIHTYRRRIKQKMNMNTNAHLVRYAVEHELIV